MSILPNIVSESEVDEFYGLADVVKSFIVIIPNTDNDIAMEIAPFRELLYKRTELRIADRHDGDFGHAPANFVFLVSDEESAKLFWRRLFLDASGLSSFEADGRLPDPEKCAQRLLELNNNNTIRVGYFNHPNAFLPTLIMNPFDTNPIVVFLFAVKQELRACLLPDNYVRNYILSFRSLIADSSSLTWHRFDLLSKSVLDEARIICGLEGK